MKIEAHLEKLRRFEHVRARMDPLRDFELWYWMTLSGGTTVINAALHAAGLTDADRHFATQIPGVYAVARGRDRLRVRLARRKDLIHVGLPPIEGKLPSGLRSAFAAMRRIEAYRDPCIRGERTVTKAVIAHCESDYVRVLSGCRRVLSAQKKR